jgi:hypothetical protein
MRGEINVNEKKKKSTFLVRWEGAQNVLDTKKKNL